MAIKKIKLTGEKDRPKLTDLDLSPGEPLLLLNFSTGTDGRDPLLVSFTSWQKSLWSRDHGGVDLSVYPYSGESFNLRVRDHVGYTLGEPIKFAGLILPNLHKKFFGPGTCEPEYRVHEAYSGRKAIIEALGDTDEFVPYATWFESKPSVKWFEERNN